MDPKQKFYEELLKEQSAKRAEALKGQYAPKPPAPEPVWTPPAPGGDVRVTYPKPGEDLDPSMLDQIKAYLRDALSKKAAAPAPEAPPASPGKLAGETSEQFIRRRMGDEAWEEEGY
jgi:hypothetical protein